MTTTYGTIHGFPIIMARRADSGDGVTRPYRVVLVDKGENQLHRYVTAIHCDGDVEWSSGSYFSIKVAAISNFNSRCRTHRVDSHVGIMDDREHADLAKMDADKDCE